jgi:hypothetical protein
MASINPIQSRRQLTAKAYYQATGTTNWINLGDVSVWSTPIDIKRTPIMDSDKGFRRHTRDLITEIGWQYDLTVNEVTKETLELITLGTSGADITQASATGLTASFSAVAYRCGLFLNKEKVSNVVVKNASNTITYVVDVDYVLDADAGVIELIDGGSIAEGVTINVTFDCAATTRGKITALNKFFTAGTMKLQCFDQHDGKPMENHDFSAQIYVTDWGTSDGSKIMEWKLRAIATSKPIVTYRK